RNFFVKGQTYTPEIEWIDGDPWSDYKIIIPDNFSDVVGWDDKGRVVALESGYAEIILVAETVFGAVLDVPTFIDVFGEKVKGIELSTNKVILDPAAELFAGEIVAWPTNEGACPEFDITYTTTPNIRIVVEGQWVYAEALSSDKGTATITFKAVDGSGKTAKATVQTGKIVQEIHFNKYERTLAVGKSLKVTTSLIPADATLKTLTWASENPEVATVKNGTIKAVGEGRTVIFAQAQDGSHTGQSIEIEVVNPANSVVIGDGAKAFTLPLHEYTEETRIPVIVLDKEGNELDQKVTIKVTGALAKNNPCRYDEETKELVIDPCGVGKFTVTVTTTDGTNKKATLNVTMEAHVVAFKMNAPKNTPVAWDDENELPMWTVKEGATVKPVAVYNWGEKEIAPAKSVQKYEIIVDEEYINEGKLVVDNKKGTVKAVKPGKYEVTFRHIGCEECTPMEDVVIMLEVTAKTAANVRNPEIVFPATVRPKVAEDIGHTVKLAKGAQVQLSALVSGLKPAGVKLEWSASDYMTEEPVNVINNKGKLDLRNAEAGDEIRVELTVTDSKNPDNCSMDFVIVRVTEKADASAITLIRTGDGADIRTATDLRPSDASEVYELAGIEGTAGEFEVKSATPKVVTVTPYDPENPDAGYRVTYVGTGKGKITVTAKDGSNVKRTINFTVAKHDVPAKRITVPVKTLVVHEGECFAVDYKVETSSKTGEPVSEPAVMWTVSDTSVAGFNFEYPQVEIQTEETEGQIVINAFRPGKFTVTGKALDGSNKTVKFTVTVVDWESRQHTDDIRITLPANAPNDGNRKQAVVIWGKSLNLKANLVPSTTKNKTVVWEVYGWNEEILDWDAQIAADAGITVKNGKLNVAKVTAKTVAPYTGDVRVVAKMPYKVMRDYEMMEIMDEIFIAVKPGIEKLTIKQGITPEISTDVPKEVPAGESIQLVAEFTRSPFAEGHLAGYPMQWTVNDSKLAEIAENGCLTIKEGAAKGKSVKVTVRTMDGSGKKATVTIKIVEPKVIPNGKVAIITPTTFQSEEDFLAAEKMKAKYPDKVITAALDYYEDEDMVIDTVASIVSDPDVKVLVFQQAITSTIAAIDVAKEINPDLLVLCGVANVEADSISPRADIIVDTDNIRTGLTIPQQVAKLGAKTLIHYSFARHLAGTAVQERIANFKSECEKLGIEFVMADA
ncbi:MAG: DUF3798 domain-containing protein, partial [Oscillospiraceae bacterium]|nr:DUF3798 domain-containing protein [Oscillospiraceae bacterium]